MNSDNFQNAYNALISETKHSTHGYWKSDDFKAWGKQALDLIDEICGVTSKYYTTFLRIHHEAQVLGASDSRFGTHVSLCISILKSAYKESIESSNTISS